MVTHISATLSFMHICSVKIYRTLQCNILQDDSTGSMKLHCSPVTITNNNAMYTTQTTETTQIRK